MIKIAGFSTAMGGGMTNTAAVCVLLLLRCHIAAVAPSVYLLVNLSIHCRRHPSY